MKKKISEDPELKALFARTCWSMWEGCTCKENKGHLGDHACIAESCDCTWTTEQADKWWEESGLKGFPK